MIWLESPPWGRWLLAIAIAAVALWVEFRPDPEVDHLVARTGLATGELLTEQNTTFRRGPAELMTTARIGEVTLSNVAEGDPVLASQAGEESTTAAPDSWVLELALPQDARIGDTAYILLLDSGRVIDAMVTRAPSLDPLGTGMGSVAIHRDDAVELASAAGDGRVAVMLASR